MEPLALMQSNKAVTTTWDENVTIQIIHSTPSAYRVKIEVNNGGTKIQQQFYMNRKDLRILQDYINDALLEDEK